VDGRRRIGIWVEAMPEIIALVVPVTALLIAAASLWQTALKPAEIVLDQLSDDDQVEGHALRHYRV
jgi:hypothetical protein